MSATESFQKEYYAEGLKAAAGLIGHRCRSAENRPRSVPVRAFASPQPLWGRALLHVRWDEKHKLIPRSRLTEEISYNPAGTYARSLSRAGKVRGSFLPSRRHFLFSSFQGKPGSYPGSAHHNTEMLSQTHPFTPLPESEMQGDILAFSFAANST